MNLYKNQSLEFHSRSVTGEWRVVTEVSEEAPASQDGSWVPEDP